MIDDPPAVGAELVGQTRIDRQYLKLNKRGLEIHFTDVVTTFTDVSGALVAEMTMVLVEQGGSRHE